MSTTSSNLPEPQRAHCMDKTVLQTKYGIIKIVEMVLDVIGCICIGSSINRHHSRSTFFLFVAGDALWYSALVLASHVCQVQDRVKCCPWKKVELALALLWALFFSIAAILCAATSSTYNDEAQGAAAFFGFLAMAVYGIDAWMSFTQLRNNR